MRGQINVSLTSKKNCVPLSIRYIVQSTAQTVRKLDMVGAYHIIL